MSSVQAPSPGGPTSRAWTLTALPWPTFCEDVPTRTVGPAVGVAVGVGVVVAVGDGVGVAVGVDVGVEVAAGVGVAVGAGEVVGVGVAVAVGTTKLPPSRKTLASKKLSLASAIASLMWLVCPAFTWARQVRTTVRPSISVSMAPPPSSRSLL